MPPEATTTQQPTPTPELLGNDAALESLLDFDGRPEEFADIPNDAEPSSEPAPEVPTAPPAKDISLPPATPLAPLAPTPKPTTELPVVPTTPTEDTPKPVTPLVSPEPSPLPSSRDYSDFTPEEAAHMQRMSNEAFAFVTQRFNEYKSRLNESAEKIKTRDAEQNNIYYEPYGS